MGGTASGANVTGGTVKAGSPPNGPGSYDPYSPQGGIMGFKNALPAPGDVYGGASAIGGPNLQQMRDNPFNGTPINGGRPGSGLAMTDAFNTLSAFAPPQGVNLQRMQDGPPGANVNGGRPGSGLAMNAIDNGSGTIPTPNFGAPPGPPPGLPGIAPPGAPPPGLPQLPPNGDPGAHLLQGIVNQGWRKPAAGAGQKVDDYGDKAARDPFITPNPNQYRPMGPPPNLPMQRGQIDFGWAGSAGNNPAGIGNGVPSAWGDYTPRFNPQAQQWINSMIYQGGGRIAPWANQIDMNDMIGSIERLSGQRFGG